ncbi:MAG: aminotransferase class V-fold PLP-dependent enzyme [Cyclobacteriaceae bacterium]|nr:aminotransferase class V-fold PLP-dependent enzyme [Cyclobacteriaceae bacterium]MDX5467793.1 aminotransferase class V-fold PLP-dependent enzyme [Cyclobacteriaceae bacterium]
MNQRRNFLQKLGMGLALPGIVGFTEKPPRIYPFEASMPENEFWEQVRASFPLTKNRIYFNNGTFGPSPFQVLNKVEEVNLSVSTSGEYGSTDPERKSLAKFLGISPEELCFTHNTTEGINIMAWGLPLNAGDEVLMTTHDHAGNALPWLNRAKLDGIVLKTFSPKNTKEENLNLIQSLCGPKTKVIAIPHVTCTTGLVFPIREIAEFARNKGIYTAIDGAHGAGTFNLNLKELECDFYAGCFHKWALGPSGTGFLYVKKEKLDELQAKQIGAYSDTGWDMVKSPPEFTGYVDSAHRFDYGTQSKALYAGVLAAAEFHQEIGREKIEARIRSLNQHLFQGLLEIPEKVEILSPEESISRISMITFKSRTIPATELNSKIQKAGFRVRQIYEGGLDGIRISTHIYNSKDDINQLLNFLRKNL